MNSRVIDRTEVRCASFSPAQEAILQARNAGRRHPVPTRADSVRVHVHVAGGSHDVVAVKHEELPAFVADLAVNPAVVRFSVGAADPRGL